MPAQGFNLWRFFLHVLLGPLATTLTLLFLVLIQAWECTPGKELSWNILSLFTTSGMLFLEVSLIAFLLQGNYASGLEDLTQPFGVSALIVGLDIFLKVFSFFLLHFCCSLSSISLAFTKNATIR
jgi:hypothetical protein